MTPLTPLALLVALHSLGSGRVAGDDRERGDVPGWVLITVMTAFIVTAIWQFIGPEFEEILQDAINNVNGGP